MGFLDKIKNVLESDKNSDIMEKNDDESQIPDESFVDDGEVKLFSNEINGNFKYLDDLIHSGVKEIVLDSNILLGDDEDYKYKEGIKLDVDDLVIEGNNHFIDARNKTRIFKCTGKNVTIRNTILKKGNGDSKGGAIFIFDGDLSIVGSTLQENDAISGGAIQNFDGKLLITDSSFTKNGAGSGGVIHNVCSADLKILKSSFFKNTAWNGAVIYNSGRANLSITESVITENESYGG